MKNFSLFLVMCVSLCLLACHQKSGETDLDNPNEFKDYIAYTSETHQSVEKPIRIELVKPLDQFKPDQEIDSKYISISPRITGALRIKNGTELIFTPKTRLKPDTAYKITLKLGELYGDVPKDLKTYTFRVKTIKPAFKVSLNHLQSYDRETQFLKGHLESADVIDTDKLSQLLKVTQDGEPLSVKWDTVHQNTAFYPFKIDSIHREKEDSKIKISWDGKPIDAETRGSEDLSIPGYNNFKIVNVKTQPAPEASVTINFSDPIDADQNFSGLVKIENLSNLRFEVDGNVLYVYPEKRVTGDVEITVFPGIKNTYGLKLKDKWSDKIAFHQLKPAVKLISKGAILPGAKSTPLYFKAVNLTAVDVNVIKIYQGNILQFLQTHDLNDQNDYNIRRVGRPLAHKTVHLDVDKKDKGYWKAYAVKLSEFFKADPGALYRVELNFRQHYSTYNCEGQKDRADTDRLASEEPNSSEEQAKEEAYWNHETNRRHNRIYDWQHRDDPCYPVYYQPRHFVATNLIGSDLGMIVKKGQNKSYTFYTRNLLNTRAESGTKIDLYNYQQQLIKTIETNDDGKAEYQSEMPVAFAVAQKNDNYAYAKLDDGQALSMSKFDVSGKAIEKGLKGFMYAERGVHRPGDTIHLTFVLNDKDNPLPNDVPVKLEIRNARGKLVQRMLLPQAATASKKNGPRKKKGFYYFPISTRDSDPTGNWQAKINVGGVDFEKTLKVAAVKPNRLKIKLDFDDKILDVSKPISGTLSSSWLQGAPARNLKAEMEVTLRADHEGFKGYNGYTFMDPVRNFEETEIPVLKTTLSANGKTQFSKRITIANKAPGMLKATFLTKVFEGGGDFSIDVYSKKLAPFSHFVGLKTPEPHRHGSFYTDEDNTFDVVSVDAQGHSSPHRKIEVQVFKIKWRWWWNRGRDHLSEYEDASVHEPYKYFELTTNAKGKADFTLNIPKDQRGRYLIRLKDKESGHATGVTTYFYRNWWQNSGDERPDNATMLVFSADKKAYNVGETAKITFPSGAGGRALVSVEDGTQVVSAQWVETQKGETHINLPITKAMAPNVYVNISLLQPHDRTKNDLPIRLYGVIPLKVEDPNTLLKPQIAMADVLKPNQDYSVTVSEKDNKPMTYTLAVVDEGLLDLTRFKTPDIHGAFFSRAALGVKTFDGYDDVIGAYSGSVNTIYEIGGDDYARGGKKHKANRFKPVVTYRGPFYLEPGEKVTHHIHMPNYIGSVRTMVVAGNKAENAYGNAEKTTPVKKPLMVLASVPRKLSPGETATIPVTVFTMGDKVKNAKIKVHTTSALQPLDGSSKSLHFDGPGDQLVNFNYKVKPTDKVQKITVEVSGNGEKASYEVELDVENPNPISHKLTTYKLEKNQSKTVTYQPYGVKGTNRVKLTLSTLPPMDFTKHLQYLIHYPHGCVEQTTSSAFPQLYLDDIFDLTHHRKSQIVRNIKATIQRLGDAQLANGAMPFWPGQHHSNAWTTDYAGHFMLEAKAKGYALPISFLDNWLRFQKNEARQWNVHMYPYDSSLEQAYRLYTLALAGQPDLAAMNRLRESGGMNNQAKWRLAAAYALAGKKQVGKAIANKAAITFKGHRYDRYTYGSPFRNRAMALETMVLLNDDHQRDLAVSLAKRLSSDRWFSTQETSYALLAMGKMIEKNGGKGMDITITQNGQKTDVQTDHALSERPLIADMNAHEVKLVNHKDNLVYVNLYQEGKLPLGKEMTQKKNLALQTVFLDGNGENVDVSKLHQGDEIEAKVTVTNTSNDLINDVALTQVFPSGWEIVNTSFTDLQGGVEGDADYTDIRDDRVYFYFDLKAGQTKSFKVKLNASYLGTYYLPGTQAEGMYDHAYFSRNKGRWIKVIP